MTTTTLLIAAVAATAALIGICRELDHQLQRRQQLNFLRGPLREQLLQAMSGRGAKSSGQPAVVVAPVQPVALLTETKRCA